MNRHSILFKLNILFTIALITTLVAGFSIFVHIVKKEQLELFVKSRLIAKEMRVSGQKPYELFETFNLTEVKGEEKRRVLQEGTKRKILQAFRMKRTPPFPIGSRIITHRGYLYLNIPKFHLLLKEKRSFWQRFTLPILVFLGIIILLVAMYTYLRKSLLPLKKLQLDIEKYGEGELEAYQLSPKKDEISKLSNAFYRSAQKVKNLTESRQLFLRNIFHELNTPVTKGKILVEVTQDQKTKEMLDSIFTRLDTLLKELAEMEKITSQSYTITKKPVPIVELIDQARDLLYLDDPIPTNVTSETVEADFATMSIVFKNLIDNAAKYGKNLKIIYEDNTLSFISEGKPLQEDLKHYTQAFSKGTMTESQKGFGLGLYIVNEILQKHKMQLVYKYTNGENWFRVNFS